MRLATYILIVTVWHIHVRIYLAIIICMFNVVKIKKKEQIEGNIA